jgi:tetratricopeptide (TPR) repeat protein
MIRKKALDLVRKQQWPAAIKEYKRLAELDQSNPNVFNELGDIYLKVGNKSDAYESFEKAIDSYTRVSLHNNAVAVAKKVLRVLPARYEVLARLGHIRHRQGLAHEAESYYASFLKSLTTEKGADPKEVAENCGEIASNAPGSVAMLEAVLECLDQHGLEEDAGNVMVKLQPLYVQQGNEAGAEQLKNKLEALGMADMIAPVRDTAPQGTVITEDNLWSESHSEGERLPVAGDEGQPAPAGAVQMGSDESNAVGAEYGEVEIPDVAATASAEGADGSPGAVQAGHFEATPLDQAPEQAPAGASAPDEADTAVATAEPEPEEAAAVPPGTVYESPSTTSPVDAAAPAAELSAAGAGDEAAAAEVESGPQEYVIDEVVTDPTPSEPVQETAPVSPTAPERPAAPAAPGDAGSAPPASAPGADLGDAVHVSAVMDGSEAPGEMTGEDFRSHYDLGMAYLEMELHADGVREFQLAARSPEFQLKCLEMIGQCFIADGQPSLAIKQLTRGLHLITGDDRVALGIRYNLGLAYQMVGDAEAARAQFEDVYVVDVTFRDVGERLKSLD